MKRRSKAQWLSLIQEFEQSGLTQTQFCVQQEVNAKYFSLRRAKLKAAAGGNSFSEAVCSQSRADSPVSIQYGNVSIQLPAASTQQIVELVRALS